MAEIAEAAGGPITKDLMTAEEVARWTGLGRGRIYEMMATGALPTVRIGKRVRVYRPALESWFVDQASTFDGERLRSALDVG